MQNRRTGGVYAAAGALTGAGTLLLSLPLLLAPSGGCAARSRAAAVAAPAAPAPKNLLGGDGLELVGASAGNARAETVPAEGAPGGNARATRVTLTGAAPANPYQIQLSEPVGTPLADGEAVTLRFWARSPGGSKIAAVVEQDGAPWAKPLNQELTLTPEWKEYALPFAGRSFPEGAALRFQLGFGPGTVEIAGERLEDPKIPAGPAAPSSPAGSDLLRNAPDWTFSAADPASAALSVVPAEGGPGGARTAYRVTVRRRPAQAWDVNLNRPVPEPVARGQVLRLHFWARSATHTPFRAVYEKNGDPFTKSLALLVAPGPAWTEYAFPFTSPRYDAGGAHVTFHLGFAPGTMEVAGARLENYGVAPAVPPASVNLDLYGGQPHTDAWRAAANARIERYRKGGLVVRVVDAKTGRPLPGASVAVKQTRHAFRFGTAVAPILVADTPDGANYRKNFLRLFNYAVLENQLKWNAGSAGPNAFADADPMLAWLGAHGVPVRGHNLFWPSFKMSPQIPRDTPPAQIRAAVEAHVRKYVAHARGKVVVWDVINEAVANHDVLDKAGRDLLWKPFVWAHQEDPGVDLCYNDYDISNEVAGSNAGHREAVFAVVNEIKSHGAPVTEMGDQSHMDVPLTPGARLVSIWDEAYRKTGLPLELTEYDAGITDDAAHAKYQDEFMTAAFSEPQVRSFVMWGFWAGAHWRAQEGGAMFRQDWSERPAVAAYERLVFHDWWTKAAGTTDAKGVYRTRAFLGTHDVTVTRGGKSVTVPARVTKNQNGVTEVTVRL